MITTWQGLSGELNIGVLEGAYLGDLFPGILNYLAEFYPQVKINLHTYSFNELIRKLYENELDIIFTLLFDLKERSMLQYQVIEKTRDYVVVHKDHRLANARYVKLSDFKDDTIIMVSTEDSEESPRLILDACTVRGNALGRGGGGGLHFRRQKSAVQQSDGPVSGHGSHQ